MIRRASIALVALLSGCGQAAAPSVSPTPSGFATPTASAMATATPAGVECGPGCIKQLPPGKHATTAFLPGMSVTLPDDSWWSSEDSPGEFNLRLIAHPGAGVFFWIDPIPVRDHILVGGVPNTPAGILNWMQGDDYLDISPVQMRTIGSGIKALSIALDVTKLAPQEGPECDAPCIDYFRFTDRQTYDFTYGTGLGEPTRLYLATIGTGNSTHTLVVSVDEQDPSDRDSFSLLESGATKILSTLQLPSKLPTS
jgi:hypothetical protein